MTTLVLVPKAQAMLNSLVTQLRRHNFTGSGNNSSALSNGYDELSIKTIDLLLAVVKSQPNSAGSTFSSTTNTPVGNNESNVPSTIILNTVTTFGTPLSMSSNAITPKSKPKNNFPFSSTPGGWSTASDLIEIIREIGRILTAANPFVLIVGNMIRRVLHIIRQEFRTLARNHRRKATANLAGMGASGVKTLSDKQGINMQASKDGSETESFFEMATSMSLLYDDDVEVDTSAPLNEALRSQLRPAIESGLLELQQELNDQHKNIADQAMDHIHANEVIMTYGYSRTVYEFLRAASRKRKFSVIVVDGGPSFSGQEMAAKLAASTPSLSVTLISDADIFAVMARINKVIVCTNAVMANGGLVAVCGMRLLSEAAHLHAVPVVVCAGLCVLCPMFVTDQDMCNYMQGPHPVLPLEHAESLENIEVDNPANDYVPPELISLYITDAGGYNPSYVYRLLSEYYSPEDLRFS